MDSHLLDKSHAMLKRKAFWRGFKLVLTLILLMPIIITVSILSPFLAPFMRLTDNEYEEAYGKPRRY